MISPTKFRPVFLAALVLGLCFPARSQTFTNPLRVPTPVDPDTVISGDFNADGRADLIWFHVGSGGSTGHIEIAQAGGGYLPGQTFTIQGTPTGVPICAAADVTRDGKLDLICATLSGSTYNTTVLVYPGNGDGTLATPVATQIGNQYGQAIILTLVGDLNADGVPDFILQDDYYTPAFVLLSDGQGGFLPTKTVGNSYNFDVPVSADINGDGILDILWPNGAAVAIGKGDGTFAGLVSPYAVGTNPVSCAFHDMDGDGKLDAVCGYLASNGNAAGTAFDILHGNGDGTFNPIPIAHKTFGSSYIGSSGSGDFIAPDVIRDVNGDGIPDILATAGDGLTVILGQPSLNFSAPQHYALAYSGFAFSSRTAAQEQYTDLNGDGVMDVVAAGPNGIYLLFGHADGSFGSAVATKISEVNGRLRVADFNGDGKPDLVSTGAPQTSLSLGNGDGTFASPVPVATSPFATYAEIYAADFNGDGKVDLLSTDSSSAYHLILGNGDGTFGSALATSGLAAAPTSVSLTATYTTSYALTGDVNSDGKADLFYIDTASTSPTYSLVAALSAGDGTFHSVTTSYPAPAYTYSPYYWTPVAPVLGDFAHSSHLDAAYYLNQSIYVVRGNGDGSFNPTPTILPVPTVAGVQATYFQALQTGDFDGDGKLDLALLSWFQPGYFAYQGGPACIFIYPGNGDGTFASPTQAGCFTHAYTDLRVTDVNGDGRPDIVLQTGSSLNNYAVGVIENQGGGKFGPELSFTAGSLSDDFFVADLNLDGRPDLIFGNQRQESGISANSVTVLLNTSAAAATGALTSAPNPSYLGQAFTITATLTPPTTGTVYSGNITFYMDGILIGSAPLSGNVATIVGPTNLASGIHQLSATWPGDANDQPLVLAATHTVLQYPLQISLTCSPDPSLLGQTVTLTTLFTATPPPGVPASGAPYTGTLSFYEGTTLLQQQQVTTTGFSFSTANLTGGTHTIVANYSTDNVFAAAMASCSQEVDKLPTTSHLTLNPVPSAGVPFPFMATVTPVFSTSLLPTGTVTFTVDGTSIGTGTVNPSTGIATFSDPGLTGGTHLLACTYAGDANFTGNICPANSIGVAPSPAVFTLISSSNPAPANTPIAFTANLSGNGKPTPGNSVAFTISANGTVQAQASAITDVNGNAIYTSPGLPAGTYNVSAVFAGTVNLQPIASATLVQVIVAPLSSFTIALSPGTLTLAPGKSGSTAINVVSIGVFAGPLNLTYGTLPAYATATFKPSTVTLVAGGTGFSTLTLNTLSIASNAVPTRPDLSQKPLVYSATFLLLLPILSRRRRIMARKHFAHLLVAVVSFLALYSLSGCTNAFYIAHSVAPGTYIVPVTATDINGNRQTANLTVVVTP